ncbi:Protochlorophyllide reductase A-like protein [Lachnellula willkommii]|uniref:Protochlorophyllide reductase A-like protein n=1 Tax=Lachnellula willkommii TaxID=215461 RepID=A0A559M3U6_9HELO|nr:Protochlorophyllide reductase A-like protein [Lachnellula willkommii]
MSDTSGTVLVTGPNGGIGIGFVSQLLQSPCATIHETIYAVRDPEKAVALQTVLKTAPKDHKHLVLPLDLTSLDNIRQFAADINKRVATGSLQPIQALVLNAGVKDCMGDNFTKDGYEHTFAVNYLANFLLSLLLLESIDKQCGRIVYVGSTAAFITGGPNPEIFVSEQQKKAFITTTEKMAKGIEEIPDPKGDLNGIGDRRYALSKLLLAMWMYEFQRRLDADPKLSNIAVLGLDPGWVGGTELARNCPPLPRFIFQNILNLLGYIMSFFSSNPLIRTPSKVGADFLRVCFDRKAFGEFPKARYVNGSELYHTPEEAADEKQQKLLWEGSLKLVGVKGDDTILDNWK